MEGERMIIEPSAEITGYLQTLYPLLKIWTLLFVLYIVKL